jgi:xanthine phosphoribosyltransferase
MNDVRKVKISWEKFHEDTIYISKQIYNIENIIGIVCITRGGLAPCAIISNLLNIRNIEVLGLQSYEKGETNNGEIKVLATPSQALAVEGEGWIIIDELADTGKSIEYAKKILPKAKIYTIYSKMKNNNLLNNQPIMFNQNDWICFPWE